MNTRQTPFGPLAASDLFGLERLAAFMCGITKPLTHWQRRRLQRQRAAKRVGRKVIYRHCDMSHCGVAHEYLGWCPCCDAGPNAGGMARELAAQDSDNSNDING